VAAAKPLAVRAPAARPAVAQAAAARPAAPKKLTPAAASGDEWEEF
jgi:methyl-accepting chemotaxis protein